MFGGMMMKYSALAGKLPITLRHNADSDGLLLNQKQAKIEYDQIDDLLKDVHSLFSVLLLHLAHYLQIFPL